MGRGEETDGGELALLDQVSMRLVSDHVLGEV